MTTVTKEIMNLARKAGYEGEDKKNVVKAIDALADTLAGENLEQATNVAAAIRKLQPYVGGGGGNPYEYLGIEFITIDIASHTLPTSGEGDQTIDEIEKISAQSTVGIYPNPLLLQITTSAEPSVNQLVIPIASEETTEIYLQATTNVGDLIPSAMTTTGDVSFDANVLYVAGPGSIENITWKFTA